jgi:predicted  nucleic acid-binding Zn-ribbon protein
VSPESEREAKLRREMNAARRRYEQAQAEARRVQEGLTDLGSDHAEGTRALRVANREVARASAEFQRALKAFAEVVMRHSRKLE